MARASLPLARRPLVCLPRAIANTAREPVTDRAAFTVTLQLSDADFQKLIDGKANAQNMFMSGKLKIKGDVMKATKLGSIMDMAKKTPAAKL